MVLRSSLSCVVIKFGKVLTNARSDSWESLMPSSCKRRLTAIQMEFRNV